MASIDPEGADHEVVPARSLVESYGLPVGTLISWNRGGGPPPVRTPQGIGYRMADVTAWLDEHPEDARRRGERPTRDRGRRGRAIDDPGELAWAVSLFARALDRARVGGTVPSQSRKSA